MNAEYTGDNEAGSEPDLPQSPADGVGHRELLNTTRHVGCKHIATVCLS